MTMTTLFIILFVMNLAGSVYFGAIKKEWAKGSYFAIHAVIDLVIIVYLELV